MCSQSTGDLFGAVFLDNAFERQIKRMIGEESYNGLSARSKKKMMGDWEHGIKRNFRHNEREGKDWFVDIPGYIPNGASDSDSSGSSTPGMLTPQLTGSTASGWGPQTVVSDQSSAGGCELGVVRLKT